MLPGGMTPVVQLIEIVRNSPPGRAANLLGDLPADRRSIVLAAMRPAEIARLLPAAAHDFRETLAAALSDDQLIKLLRLEPVDRAVALLLMLTDERLEAIAGNLPEDMVSALLARVPAERQAALLRAMGPDRELAAVSRRYEHDVANALVRANVDVSVPIGAPSGITLVHGLGARLLVAARYGDDGRIALREAEDGAYRMGASGALAVTNLKLADEVTGYCRQSRQEGRAVEALTWVDGRYDGILKRALVGLLH